MEATLEAFMFQPLKLIEDTKKAIREADSSKQECQELGTQVETLAKSLRDIIRLVKHGNSCFCERSTSRIMEDVSKALEKCCALVRRCKKGGFLKRVIAITSATDFRRATISIDSALANVNWLLTVATEEDAGVPGMPPIASAVPLLAVVWAMLAKLQGGTPKAREGAASYFVSLASASEQNGELIIAEGGLPQLLRLLKDGTLDGQLLAATVLGQLAVLQQRVQRIAEAGVIPAFVHKLADGPMLVQAKVAWALAEMVSHDPHTQSEFGSANAIKLLVVRMLETMDDLFPDPPVKAASLQSVVRTSMATQRSGIDYNSGGIGTFRTRIDQRGLRKSDSGIGWEAIRNNQETPNDENPDRSQPDYKGKHTRSTSDSIYIGLTTGDINRRERGKQPPEVKRDLKTQVTRALWLLARDNAKNSRMIADTKAVLGFAKLMETERGEVQRNVIMAVMELALVAEKDADLRRFAFKPNSPAAKAVVDQLLIIIRDPSEDPNLQESCIRAIGCLARTFPARGNKVIKCLVMKLCYSDENSLPVAAAAVTALLKFVDDDNYLRVEHSRTIVEVPALPYLVQLAALEKHKSVQAPALMLLSQLALLVGDSNEDSFQEAVALSVLKSVASSSMEELVIPAILSLQFFQAGGDSHAHRHHH